MRHLHTIMATIAVVALMAGCDINDSENGDLDGFWHLVTVDSIANGRMADYSEKGIYWSFQGKLYNLKSFDDSYPDIVGHFRMEGDSIFLEDTYLDRRLEGDIKVHSAETLTRYGVNTINEHFMVEGLSGSKMTLRSNTLRLKFKKQ